MTDPFASTEDGSSLSGHERNVLFLSRAGRQFENVSGISGADDPADGRAVALLDYDRDGWQDLAVVNANSPMLQLFRNEIGARVGAAPGPGVLALRLVGGNHGAKPSPGLSNRDAVGARIEIELPDRTLVRTRRAGEGFAAQNSATLLVGVGAAPAVRGITVHWPSGLTQRLGPVAIGSLVTIHETPSGDAPRYEVAAYALQGLGAGAAQRHARRPAAGQRLAAAQAGGAAAPLRLLTTMATWCASCRGELPQLAKLREVFPPEQLALLAVPIDEDDGAAKLAAYVQKHRPAYELLTSLSEPDIESVRQVVLRDLKIDALPATIATDAQGRVVRTWWDVPSVSEVRGLLEALAQ